MNKVNGFSCVEKLLHDKERAENGDGPTIGKFYYAEMRRTYQSPDNALAKLKIKDEKVLMDETLLDAMEPLLESKPDVGPMVLWTECVETVNQTSFCGFLKQLCSMPPSDQELLRAWHCSDEDDRALELAGDLCRGD